MNPFLSLIVPAYNEEKYIFNTLYEIHTTFKNIFSYEVIVVDDGSIDGTFAMAQRAADEGLPVTVVKTENGGKGAALKKGFEYVHGNVVSFIDADLDLHPRQLTLFHEIMTLNNADVVVGSKRHPNSMITYPLSRKFLSRCYQCLVRILFRLNIQDTQAGLKLFTYSALADSLPKVMIKRYAFDLELLVNICHRGYTVVEAPIDLRFQRFTSRISIGDIWCIFVDTAAIFYRLRILHYYDRNDEK